MFHETPDLNRCDLHAETTGPLGREFRKARPVDEHPVDGSGWGKPAV
ncbi:MAG: hypothetical protein ACI92G_004709 [Candidatus Pelagisphaera sp.]